MILELSWEEMEAAYPCRELDVEPDYILNEVFYCYGDACRHQEYLECLHERGGFEIVKYQGKYYIIG